MKKTLALLFVLFTTILFLLAGQRQSLLTFLPEGYVIFEKVYGDLNHDGIDDCVIIIKGTDPSKIITDQYRGKLDQNRRGIIVLIYNKDHYEIATKNLDCFSSENEDGGIYFPPELSVNIDKGNLIVNFSHGRYGFWNYVFKFKHSDFKLISYNASSKNGPIINTQTSINFLTKKKIIKENTNKNAESGDEIFHTTKTKIYSKKLINLSEIIDFDVLHISEE